MKLYFLSTNPNLYNKIIEPRIPDNYAIDIGMEDNQTKRIDVEFTGELWILEPVKLIYQGEIVITDRKEIWTSYKNPRNNDVRPVTNLSYEYKFIDEEFLIRI